MSEIATDFMRALRAAPDGTVGILLHIPGDGVHGVAAEWADDRKPGVRPGSAIWFCSDGMWLPAKEYIAPSPCHYHTPDGPSVRGQFQVSTFKGRFLRQALYDLYKALPGLEGRMDVMLFYTGLFGWGPFGEILPGREQLLALHRGGQLRTLRDAINSIIEPEDHRSEP